MTTIDDINRTATVSVGRDRIEIPLTLAELTAIVQGEAVIRVIKRGHAYRVCIESVTRPPLREREPLELQSVSRLANRTILIERARRLRAQLSALEAELEEK